MSREPSQRDQIAADKIGRGVCPRCGRPLAKDRYKVWPGRCASCRMSWAVDRDAAGQLWPAGISDDL